MKATTATFPLYDLTNPHLQNVQVITRDNKIIKGQFVQLKVVEDEIEYLYPSEKYCFLPVKNQKEFWAAYNLNNGEFKELPEYLLHFGLDEMTRIIIEPVLIF